MGLGVMRVREGRIEFQGSGSSDSGLLGCLPIGYAIAKIHRDISLGQRSIGGSVLGIGGDRFLEIANALPLLLDPRLAEKIATLLIGKGRTLRSRRTDHLIRWATLVPTPTDKRERCNGVSRSIPLDQNGSDHHDNRSDERCRQPPQLP